MNRLPCCQKKRKNNTTGGNGNDHFFSRIRVQLGLEFLLESFARSLQPSLKGSFNTRHSPAFALIIHLDGLMTSGITWQSALPASRPHPGIP